MPSDRPGQGIRTTWPPQGRARAESPTEAYDASLERLATRCQGLYAGVRATLARQTGDEYTPSEKPFSGGTDPFGVRRDPTVWQRLAQMMIEYSIDPVLFMQAQVVGGRIPPPASLVSRSGSTSALARYRAFMVDEAARIGRRLQLETTEAQVAFSRRSRELPELTMPQVWRGVLHDEHLPISPLWRFCAAVAEGFDDIAAELSGDAIDQYLSYTAAYDKHWISILPGRLRQEAAAIRAAAGVRAWQTA